jgi:hypothetical protein
VTHVDFDWGLAGFIVACSLGFGALLWASYPRRADERTRSEEQQ